MRPWLVVMVAAAIALGIFFRCYNLERKVVWSDEIWSQLHVAGLTEGDVVARAATVRDSGTLQAFIVRGSTAKSIRADATIRSLADEDPQHPPLYFELERTWISLFGDGLQIQRLLPALIGIAVLPAAYWLAFELFGSVSCAWMLVALVSISPYFVLYSQENREYSLWAVAVLLLSVCALRAVRLMSVGAWGAYAASIVFALYTYPLSFAVLGGHVAYFLLAERKRLATSPIRPVLAVTLGVASFIPWLVVIAHGSSQIEVGMAWIVSRRDPLLQTMRVFFSEWHLATIDFNVVTHSAIAFGVSAVAFAITVATFVFLQRNAKASTWTFVFCIAIASVSPILLPDLFVAGQRSGNPRYLVPFFLCIEIALAYFLWRVIDRDVRWNVGFVTVVFVGSLSCAASAQAQTWWTKYNENSIELARRINSSKRPIVVSDNYVHYILSLTPYLKPGTRIALAPRCYLCRGSKKHGNAELSQRISSSDDVFLLGPSEALQNSVRARSSIRADRVFCIDIMRNCTSSLRLF